ncbi:MAG: hypothetical protein ABI760_05650 [Ferruginibacter sp.]
MKIFLCSCVIVSIYYLGLPFSTNAQAPADSAILAMHRLSPGKSLFETDEVLDITLRGNIRDLLKDRSENPKYHPMLLLYTGENNSEISAPVEVKTRGHFRKLKENCIYPPLSLNFSKSDLLKPSIFKKQDKIKLVMPCQGDKYVIREWLVYKLYNLVTPKSFRTRLVRVKLDDTKNKKAASPFYGILLEEEKQMAKRNGAVAVTRKIRPEQTNEEAFLTTAVFEYLIGNTDWSVQYLQNIKLLAPDSNAVPTTVPYDFDYSGLVNAPYAKPPEQLLLSSVSERRYRGYCIRDMKKFDGVIALYNRLKKEIYGMYTDCPLLDEKYIKTTIKYLDEFYVTINNPGKVQKEFEYPCFKNGTGNVVIKGLKED